MPTSSNRTVGRVNFNADACTVTSNNGNLEIWVGNRKVKTFDTIPDEILFKDNVRLDVLLDQDGRDLPLGTSASEIILGMNGNDRIRANAGDKIDGGAGYDTVSIIGNRNDYTIQRGANDVVSVTSRSGDCAPITLSAVEKITFDDVDVYLGTNGADDLDLPFNDQENRREKIYLGGKGNDLITVYGRSTIYGGAGNDTVSINHGIYKINFSYTSENGALVWTAREDDGSVTKMYDVERFQLNSTRHALRVGTERADRLAYRSPVVVLSGDGNDTVSGVGGYFDLGQGNDSLSTSADNGITTYVHASEGNDHYSISGSSIYLDYSDVGAVNMSIKRKSRNPTTFSLTASKGRNPASDPDRGTFVVTQPSDNGINIYTGNQADTIDLENFYAGSGSQNVINMGGGNDVLNISGKTAPLEVKMGAGENSINFGRDTVLYGSWPQLHLQDDEKTKVTSATNIILEVITAWVSQSLSINLADRKAMNGTETMLTWDKNTKTRFNLSDLDTERAQRADTITGSAGDDFCVLGSGDRADLGAGDDEAQITSGNINVDGGDGQDTMVFSGNYIQLKEIDIDVDLKTATFLAGNQRSTVTFRNFERFKFEEGKFKGSANNEKISVYSGDSTITGNGGNDTFIFQVIDGKADITDFARGDNIDLSNINLGGLRRSDFRFIIDRNTFSVNFDNGHGYESSFKITAGNNYQFQQRDISLPDGWGWQT